MNTPVNNAPGFKNYVVTGNPADIVTPGTVSQAISQKVDAVNGQVQNLRYLFQNTMRTLDAAFGDLNTVANLGAASDGSADCSGILSSVTGSITFSAGIYLVTNNVTINANALFLPGTTLQVKPGVSVIFNKLVVAQEDQEIFTLVDTTASVHLIANKTVSMGWFTGCSTGAIDVGTIATAQIYDADVKGRHIVFPSGKYLALTPIYINGRNYISLTGPGPAMRSNIEYNPAPTYAGGGALIEVEGYAGIHDANPGGSFSRTSGLFIGNLTFSGHLGGPNKQTGILLERNGDGANIVNCTCISFNGGSASCGINLFAQDTAAIVNTWVGESANCIAIGTGKEIMVSGCKLGAQPAGITINMSNSIRCHIAGNNIFPDGATNINMAQCQWCRVSDNIMSSRFTGMITGYGLYGCSINDNTFRVPEDTNTNWWVGADPQNRDVAYGILYLDGSSFNTTISDNDFWVYTDPNAAKATCAIRCINGASGTVIKDNTFNGNNAFTHSNQLIVIENDPGIHGPTYVLDSCTQPQLGYSGSVITRFLGTVPYVPTTPMTVNQNAWRPLYHTSPPAQWMNDIQRPLQVNGKWYGWYLYNGTYFNTSNNNGTEWRQISTTNFAEWTDDNLISIPKYTLTPPQGDPWTGSSVIDVNNTAGFGAGTIIAITTMAGDSAIDTGQKNTDGSEKYLKGQSNFLWYTNDITKPMAFYGIVAKNPGLVEGNGEANFRDPSIFWDSDRGNWVCAEAEGYKVGLYTSPDLKTWKYVGGSLGSRIANAGTIECPHLVKMSNGSVTKWVLFFGCNLGGTITGYQVGSFDGSNFTPDKDSSGNELPIGTLDSGPDLYASVVWQDSDGNTFTQGWMNNWDYATALPTNPSYMGNMSLTRQLRLTENANYIYCNPVAPQNQVFNTMTNGMVATISDSSPYPTPVCNNNTYRLDVSLSPVNGTWPTSVRLGIMENNTSTTSIVIDGKNNLLTFNRSNSGQYPTYYTQSSQNANANTLVLTSTVGIAVGMTIMGIGIPVATTITAVSPGSNTITISNNTNGSVAAFAAVCIYSPHWTKDYVATITTNGSCDFSVFVDNSTVEIFSADGKSVLSAVVFPPAGATGRSIKCTGGSVIVNKFNTYQM